MNSRLKRLTMLTKMTGLAFISFWINSASAQKRSNLPNTGILKISFVNTVNGLPLVLADSSYTNTFGETYIVNKLRYYITNVHVGSKTISQKEKGNYQLVDAARPESMSFSLNLKPGSYASLNFLLGVDSLHNCSGAQTGALDPMNDMFWTWNNGYVMFKFEASSPQSNQFNNRVEYHIGGYAGPNNVIKKIALAAAFKITPGKTTEVIIQADINKLWQGESKLSIATTAVCTTPGPLAKKIADNYSSMFSIKQILPKQD